MQTTAPQPQGLSAVLSRLSKHLIVLIPLFMLAGLLTGAVIDLSALKVLVLPLTMLMVYPMLVTFRIEQIAERGDWKAVGLAMAINLAVMPLIAWLLARLFFADQPGFFVGMVLAGLFPTSGMTISWTGFAKGNVGAALKMTVVGLLAASLLAPLYLKVFAGAVVPVDMVEVLTTVLLVVGIPLVAGQLTRILVVRFAGKETFQKRVAPAMPGVSTLGVLGIVFVAVGLKAEMILAKPALLLVIAAPLLVFYAFNFALSTWVARTLLPRGDGIALVYGTVMRNLSIALGVAIASFGPEAALVLAAAYIVQVQGAAWYVRLTDRVFGPPAVAQDTVPPTLSPEPAVR
jgi:ACR3 family arsenite efflux pump ArsB